MFKAIFRGCNCKQCRISRTRKDKESIKRLFRRKHKQKLLRKDYEIERPSGVYYC